MWVFVAIAVFMMIFTIVSVTTFDRSDRSLFGYKAFIVLSDSMSKTDFDAGDLVLVKEVDCSTLKEGDIIAYTSQNTSNFGEIVTHKIRRLTTDASGNPGFVTYGTTTDTDDETIVTYDFVVGKYQGSIPKVGKFFMFLKTTPGYIICILIPFLILIISEAVRCINLFTKYKSEQQQELASERERIEAERAETQRLMNELLEMRAQMNGSPQQQTAAQTAAQPQTAAQTAQPTQTAPTQTARAPYKAAQPAATAAPAAKTSFESAAAPAKPKTSFDSSAKS